MPPKPPALTITAAASRIRIGEKRKPSRTQDWQSEAWGFFDCLDAETEILTADGWRHHDQIDAGTSVLTLDPDAGVSQWQEVEFVRRYEVTDEPLVVMQQRDHHSISTFHHRWPVMRTQFVKRRRAGRAPAWKLSENLNEDDFLRIAAPCADLPTEPKWSDAFVELVAWFFTEGTISHRDHRRDIVLFYQSERANPIYTARIRLALQVLFGPGLPRLRRESIPRWTENSRPNGMVSFRLNADASMAFLDVAPNKYVSLDFIRSLTRAQLQLFVSTAMAADGHIPSQVIGQSDPKRLEAIELAVILLGQTPRTWTDVYDGHERQLLRIKRRTSVRIRKHQKRVEKYSGTIWCPKTPNGTWLAKRSGTVYWTGNTVGEAKFAIYYIANHLAKMRLYPALIPPDPRDTPTPDSSDEGQAALDALRGPNGTYSEIIKELAVNWQVAGECYLVGTEPTGTPISAQTWDILSTDEIRITDDGFQVRDAPNTPERQLSESQAYVVRMWIPHPRYGDRPDSLFRGVLASCEEITRLERAIRSAAKSRAAGPGLLLIPDEVSFGAADPTTETDGDGEAYSDPFTRALIDAMVTPIKDEGSASSVVPLVVRAPADMLDKIRKVDLSMDIDEKLMTLERAITRLAWGLNVPPEIILGKGDTNHWPCSSDTEVYTRDGWVTHDKLDVGTEVLALDHSSGVSRWEPLAGVVRAEVTDRPMVEFTGHYHSSLTTFDHRWPIVNRDGTRSWTRTDALAADHRGSYYRPRIILGVRHAEIPSEPKFSDAFVELLAWATTDADLTKQQGKQRRSLRIRQRRADNIPSIRRALTDVHHSERPDHSAGVVSFLLSADATEQILPYGDVQGTRWTVSRPTIDLFTAGQLELFLATTERANGGDHNGRTVFAVDPRRLEPIEYAAILLGYRITTRKRNQQHGFGDEPVTRVSWGTRTTFAVGPEHAKEVSYTGTIFCPRVPIGRSFLARRNGTVFFTGNTAFSISEDVFSAHVEPLAIPMVIALTNEYYRPYLIASGMSEADASRRVLWYDPTPLISRPNRSSDADFGLEHIALSDAAWRRAKGFAEDDAPGVDEAIKRLILQRGSFDPVFTSILMKMLGLVDKSTIDVINQPPVPSPTPALPAPEVGPPDEDRPTKGGPPRRGGSLVVVASAAPTDDGRRLLDADIDFETRIHAAADAAYTRATERATSQIISRFRSDDRFSLRTIPKATVAAIVGRAAIAEVGLNLSDTLREAFTPLHDRFVAAAERLYARAARVTGIAITPDLTRITEAAAHLTDTLTAFAAERLFDPDPNTDLFGELDDTTVPYAYIRDAATRAGGGATTNQPPGGIACGTLVLSTLARAGITIDGWEWVYTERSRTRAYSPHADLDGVRFTSWTDAALANRSTWPPVSHYYPGDHERCVCKMAPVLSVAGSAEEAV